LLTVTNSLAYYNVASITPLKGTVDSVVKVIKYFRLNAHAISANNDKLICIMHYSFDYDSKMELVQASRIQTKELQIDTLLWCLLCPPPINS
jgi:hypothetical protein